jgi:hypothetical protein
MYLRIFSGRAVLDACNRTFIWTVPVAATADQRSKDRPANRIETLRLKRIRGAPTGKESLSQLRQHVAELAGRVVGRRSGAPCYVSVRADQHRSGVAKVIYRVEA